VTTRSTAHPGSDIIIGLDGNDVLFRRRRQRHPPRRPGRRSSRDTRTRTGSITANLTTGIVSGAGVGTDILSGVERIRGSSFADTYIATGFNAGTSPQPGTSPLFNEFEGMGGNDTITGNGHTRVSYLNAAAGSQSISRLEPGKEQRPATSLASASIASPA
jgi:hypothetical protein